MHTHAPFDDDNPLCSIVCMFVKTGEILDVSCRHHQGFRKEKLLINYFNSQWYVF